MAGMRSRLAARLGTPRGLSAVAFAAAVVVWYAVRAATGNSLTVRDIPVDVLVPAGMEAAATRPVDVVFLGSKDDLRVLYRDAITVTLDLRARTETGAVTVGWKSLRVNAPGSARVEAIRPATVQVRLEKALEPVVEEEAQRGVAGGGDGALPAWRQAFGG